MAPLALICWVFAFVFFCIAALKPPDPPSRYSFIAAGLAFIALAEIFGRAGALFTH